jgi:hypothetical protein
MLRRPGARAGSRIRATVHSRLLRGLRYPARGAVPLLVLALGACGLPVEPKIPRNHLPLGTSGYVGGVFSNDGPAAFGFRLQNEQSKETYVLEIDDDAVSLIAVRPGRYHVESWLTWFGNKISAEQAFEESDPIGRPFNVQAGQVILLGEWRADFVRNFNNGTYTFTLLKVRITEPGAIRMLQEAYPRFMDVRVQCLHCIP